MQSLEPNVWRGAIALQSGRPLSNNKKRCKKPMPVVGEHKFLWPTNSNLLQRKIPSHDLMGPKCAGTGNLAGAEWNTGE
jgi:hypothetical protein